MKTYSIATIPGDGIGPEVTREARKILDAAGDAFGFALTWQEYPFGAEYYLKHRVGLPGGSLDELAGHDALLLGAIGDPRVPPGPLEHEILLTLRFHFDQYINLRPALSFPGVPLPVPLPDGQAIDAVIVRENTEDMYMGVGGSGRGSYHQDIAASRGRYTLTGGVDVTLPDGMESAFTLGMMTRGGVERVTKYAAELTRSRGEKGVTVVSKANAVPHLYGFWGMVVREVAAGYGDLEFTFVNVDAMCYLMPRRPTGWGVVLCPNLFGDIVSDLLSALAGGLGLAAAGNIGDGLSMFEPVHGSAPDIAGTGKATPLAAILSGALLLRHLGEGEAAAAVDKAVHSYLTSDLPKPVEQGGTASTSEAGDAVRRYLVK
ncbi:MAG: hypothetical protein LUE17_08590 [Planctomycetaceae bacterium]|nr:hypothetical protein [Planctomycetaceae bacterium]